MSAANHKPSTHWVLGGFKQADRCLAAARELRSAGETDLDIYSAYPLHGAEEALVGHGNVTVDVFHELVVDFARKHEAKTMVKGLRVIADFEWEFQMNRLNHLLAPEIETMYVMSSPQYSFISSSGVKEIASFGGKVDELVPEAVARRFRELFPNGRPGAPLSPEE